MIIWSIWSDSRCNPSIHPSISLSAVYSGYILAISVSRNYPKFIEMFQLSFRHRYTERWHEREWDPNPRVSDSHLEAPQWVRRWRGSSEEPYVYLRSVKPDTHTLVLHNFTSFLCSNMVVTLKREWALYISQRKWCNHYDVSYIIRTLVILGNI